ALSAEEEVNPELVDMTHRFWVSLVLTIPVLAIAMSEMLLPGLTGRLDATWRLWLQLVLATPVVLWGGWPFFVRGWQSIVNRSLNMFTLIALGVAVAWVYSAVATAFPGASPQSFRT